MGCEAPLMSFDDWYADFGRRFPGQITATGETREQLLQLIFSLDSMKAQQWMVGAEGSPVFRLPQVAQALGINHRVALRSALASSLVSPHLSFERSEGGRRPVAALTLGGVVALVAVLSPMRYVGLPRQHQQRRSLAVAIIRALPGDVADVGGAINRFVRTAYRH